MDLLSTILQGIFQVFLMSWWILAPILLLAAWQNMRKVKWVQAQEHVFLTIRVPKSNEKDPTAAEMMFAALHGILRPKADKVKEGSVQEHFSFEMTANQTSINFFVWVPAHLRDFIESQIYAQYPSAEIAESEDYAKNLDIDNDGIENSYSTAELKLVRNELVPLKTFSDFKVDPLAGITSALSNITNSQDQIWIQILTRPISDEWQQKGIAHIQSVKSGKKVYTGAGSIIKTITGILGEMFSFFMSSGTESKAAAPSLAPHVESELSAIEEKIMKLGFEVKIRVMSIAESKVAANQRLQAAIGAFKQFNTINLNGFVAKRISNDQDFLQDYRARAFYDSGYILNTEELASVYHLPHTSVETPNINWTSSKTSEPPTFLPTLENTPPEELTLFAETNFRQNATKFGIKTDDRRRHMYLVGKSGMGKSKLLEQMMQQDINKGNGFALIDPNGDLVMDVMKAIPEHRIKDVILLDPADADFPVAFNPLEFHDESMKSFVAQGFISVLEKMFGHSWGPRLEYILNHTVLALLDYPDRTLLGVVRMLTDKNFRKKVVDNCKDPVVKKFWVSEFATYTDKFASEAVAPILNKVGQFSASPMIRNIMGQPKSSFNIREIMDNNKILLINLATGRVGEVNSSLLGGLIITQIQLCAMSRASIPPEERVDFVLYVDEFQHFANESFATILSEARKYKLSLVVANQYINQMEDSVRDAVFGNVGTMVTFRVGAEDGAHLEKEFFPPFDVQDIINLDRQLVYIKTSIDGMTTLPFSAKTISIPDVNYGNTEKIIEHSRLTYSKSKLQVEADIARWNNMEIVGMKEALMEQTVGVIQNPLASQDPITGQAVKTAPETKNNEQKYKDQQVGDKDVLKTDTKLNTTKEQDRSEKKDSPASLNSQNGLRPNLNKPTANIDKLKEALKTAAPSQDKSIAQENNLVKNTETEKINKENISVKSEKPQEIKKDDAPSISKEDAKAIIERALQPTLPNKDKAVDNKPQKTLTKEEIDAKLKEFEKLNKKETTEKNIIPNDNTSTIISENYPQVGHLGHKTQKEHSPEVTNANHNKEEAKIVENKPQAKPIINNRVTVFKEEDKTKNDKTEAKTEIPTKKHLVVPRTNSIHSQKSSDHEVHTNAHNKHNEQKDNNAKIEVPKPEKANISENVSEPKELNIPVPKREEAATKSPEPIIQNNQNIAINNTMNQPMTTSDNTANNFLINKKESQNHHRIEKSEKVITVANFKDITEIHPNEKVVIRPIQELKKNEVIRFDQRPKDHK